MRPVFDLVEHEVKIETVPQRVARAALQLMRPESTGAHFTLKLANSGMTSVGRARFKSPHALCSSNRSTQCGRNRP
jgi:hypothetical protein